MALFEEDRPFGVRDGSHGLTGESSRVQVSACCGPPSEAVTEYLSRIAGSGKDRPFSVWPSALAEASCGQSRFGGASSVSCMVRQSWFECCRQSSNVAVRHSLCSPGKSVTEYIKKGEEVANTERLR